MVMGNMVKGRAAASLKRFMIFSGDSNAVIFRDPPSPSIHGYM